jgi:hypothetical protein
MCRADGKQAVDSCRRRLRGGILRTSPTEPLSLGSTVVSMSEMMAMVCGSRAGCDQTSGVLWQLENWLIHRRGEPSSRGVLGRLLNTIIKHSGLFWTDRCSK